MCCCRCRYLFFLQVKQDVLQGRLPVTFDEVAELSAYAVQCTCKHIAARRMEEGNVLFNNTLNTFYLWLYGVRHTILIVRKVTRCCHIGYSFRLAARVLLYAHPTGRIAHTTAFVTPVVEHWLEREIAEWVHHMKDRSDDPSRRYALTTELHLAPYSS